MRDSQQQKDSSEGESDTEKCKKLTEEVSALKEQLQSLQSEHVDVKEKRDFYMDLFESIPEVEKPKRQVYWLTHLYPRGEAPQTISE